MSLDQLFDQFLGSRSSASTNQQARPGNTGGGISDILSQFPGGAAGGLAAGGLLGVMLGNKKMRKTAGKMAGGAVKVGGAALLGAVAYNAYKNWQAGKEAPAGGTSTAPAQLAHDEAEVARFDPAQTSASDGNPFQITLVKAMIAAANADGHIDRDEQKAIFDAVNKMELEADDKALVFDTLQNPPDIKQIAALSTGMEQAAEIYLVSRLAIDPDHPSERAYLDDLALYLSIPDDLRAHLEAQVNQAVMA